MDDFEAIRRGVELITKARRAVERRMYTDRIGSDWRVGEGIGSLEGTPEHFGIKGTARMYYSEDGTKYEIFAFDFSGKQIGKPVQRKSLDAAFRAGQKMVA